MITFEDGGRAEVRAALWRRCVAVSELVVGRDWRRVFTLALTLLVAGVAMVAVSDRQVWDEIGTGFIGGSVVGLVFAIAQHTLDLRSVERQIADDLRLTVSSTSDLEGIDLGGADLSSAYLWRKRLRSARMDRARLVGADLRSSDLSQASLRGADLRRADLGGTELREAVLDGADLTGAEVPAGHLSGARLVGAVLVGANLVDTGESVGTDLSGADLDDARLRNVRLPGAHASFASARRADATGAVLRGADLSCADLRGVSLAGADLQDADLTGADLRGAVMSRADLRRARLVGARLEHADLMGAVVAEADLRAADLRGAYLTNVDLSAAGLDGARVRAGDLDRSDTRSGLSAGLLVDAAVPAGAAVPLGAGAGGGGASGAVRLGRARRVGDPAWSALGGRWSGPAGGGARDLRNRLNLVAARLGAGGADHLDLVTAPALGGLAVAVAARLRARRAGLDRVNGDLDGIHLRERHPYAGEPDHHGLPASVSVRHRPRRRRGRLWAELRPADGGGGVELVVHPPGSGALVVAREPAFDGAGPGSSLSGDDRPGDETGPAGRLASAVQAALADPEVFSGPGELAAFAGWLERPEAPVEPVLDVVLRHDPRNPVALILRAFSRESSNVRDMDRASDEARIAWAASESDLVRALAATRLAWAQAQTLHRASAPSPVLARARAAADAALHLFDGMGGGWRPSRRLLVLRVKAENAWAFSRHVTEDPDDLPAGIDRYRHCVRLLERRGLPVSPRIHNSLAYCLMTAAGRFTPGPGAGYAEAIDHLRRLLGHYGLREDAQDGGHGAVDEATRRTTIGVGTLARRSAAGQGPPADMLLRQRSLRVGLVNLGNLYRLDKRFEAALDCHGAALYCDPDYIEAYAERAWVHLERGDRAAADADIRRALGRDVGTAQQKVKILTEYVAALERVGLGAEQGPWLVEAHRLDSASPEVDRLLRQWKEGVGGRP